MKLSFFKTLWGNTESLHAAAGAASQAGFAGLEGPCPAEQDGRLALVDALGERGLEYIAEISTTGFAVPDPGAGVEQHLDAFKKIIERSLPVGPLLFTAMAGSDLWSFRESVAFLREAKRFADAAGVRVGFETHRSRSLFHPIRTKELLAELPDLELTIDFSHWCVVCERLVLDELPDVLALCAGRVLHIQPRVGYDQGAQVPDPRSPRYAAALEAHVRWWKELVAGMAARQFARATFTPEFGPDGYQQIALETGEPAGNLWEFNTWIASYLKTELL